MDGEVKINPIVRTHPMKMNFGVDIPYLIIEKVCRIIMVRISTDFLDNELLVFNKSSCAMTRSLILALLLVNWFDTPLRYL